MAVSVQKIRDLLDNPAATSVPADTISANINRAIGIIDTIKDPDATTTNIDNAVAAVTTWLTYGSYMEGITQQLGNISVADQTKLDHLRITAELFINQVSATNFDLDTDADAMDKIVGISPEAFVLSTSEAHSQGT